MRKKKTIGEQIAYWRKKRKMTQQELAVKVGVAKNTVISGYENNQRRPSAPTLEKIANALDCEVEVILKDKE